MDLDGVKKAFEETSGITQPTNNGIYPGCPHCDRPRCPKCGRILHPGDYPVYPYYPSPYTPFPYPQNTPSPYPQYPYYTWCGTGINPGDCTTNVIIG